MKRRWILPSLIMVVFLTLGIPTATALYYTPRDQWVPTSGSVDIGAATTNSRYVFHLLTWRNNSAKSLFTSSNAYEHEVLFYAYSTTPYSTQVLAGGVFQCDLPACYADVNLLDEQNFYGSANEKSVGFGTYDPDTLVAGTDYTAYMETVHPLQHRPDDGGP